MPNTTLPTDVTAGTGGHVDMHQVTNRELNRISRDTGWRDISGFITSGWTVDAARIRRVDDLVVLELSNLDSAGAESTGAPVFRFGADAATQVSSQFTPDGGSIRLPSYESTGAGVRVGFYLGSAAFYASFAQGTATGTTALQITWRVFRPDGWPTFLPPEA